MYIERATLWTCVATSTVLVAKMVDMCCYTHCACSCNVVFLNFMIFCKVSLALHHMALTSMRGFIMTSEY